MGDPKEQHPDHNELDLDLETVTDLEPDSRTAEDVRGGRTGTRQDNCTGKLTGCIS